MLDIHRILVPTDLSDGTDRAASVAAHLADTYQADIHLLHVVPADIDPISAFWHRLAEDGADEAELERHLQDALRQTHGSALAEAPSVEYALRRSADIVSEILLYATESDADMIVMGTHGHRGLTHPALGGTTGDVLRRAEIPVMTVRTPEEGHPDQEQVQHVLAPIDFDHQAERTVRTARAYAAAHEAHLHLLFVAEERTVPLFSDTGLPGLTTLRMDPEITARAKEALSDLFDHVGGPDVNASFHRASGHPAGEIVQFIEANDIDTVIMSTRAAEEQTVFSFGSVTERVVRRAHCPVLTLKGAGLLA